MRILITGAGGMLGSDMAQAVWTSGHEAIALDHCALDVTDGAAVDEAIASAHPDVVVNCAAWTDVDRAEACESQAIAVNGTGAGHLATAAARLGARIVQISSDYVFDGSATQPIPEDATTAPLSAYGRSKLAGERAVAAAGGVHAIVRSSWLFGTGGPNFVATMLRLGREREEIAVVDDQVGCPTYTGHLAAAVLALIHNGAEGVHHAPGAGAASWHAFAAEIFRQACLPTRVLASSTAEQNRPAPRPSYSVLAVTRPDTPRLAPWTEGLAAYLTQRGAEVTA